MLNPSKANRLTNRFSQLASLQSENDTEVEDELARGKQFEINDSAGGVTGNRKIICRPRGLKSARILQSASGRA